MDGDKVIAIRRRDELKKGITSMIVAVGAERFPVGGGQDEVGVHRRVEFRRLTGKRDALPLLRGKAIEVIAIAARLTVDGDVEWHRLSRRRVFRLLPGDVDQ